MTPKKKATPSHEQGRSLAGTVVVVATVALLPVALLFVGVWLVGWQLAVVRTGSMAPAMPAGSLAVTSPITADEVEAGMVLEFADPTRPDRIITHRVIEVHRDPGTGQPSFVTRGDANSDRDTAEVPPENVRAKVRWHIPALGRIVWMARWPRSLLFVLVPLLLIAGSGLRGGRRRAPSAAAADPTAGALGPPAACRSCAGDTPAGARYCCRCGMPQARRDRSLAVGRP